MLLPLACVYMCEWNKACYLLGSTLWKLSNPLMVKNYVAPSVRKIIILPTKSLLPWNRCITNANRQKRIMCLLAIASRVSSHLVVNQSRIHTQQDNTFDEHDSCTKSAVVNVCG